MKLIAHRGASLERPENTIDSLEYGSELGAFAVECDVRTTADGRYVIFHDDNMKRLGNDDRAVSDVTFDEMNSILEAKGHHLMTLDELFTYRGEAFVLLHIKLDNPDEGFFRNLYDSPVRFICGTTKVEMTRTASKVFPSERILAFMETGNTREEILDGARAHFGAGAGIIRLWEQWLKDVTPDDVRGICTGAEVFIMSNDPVTGMNGNKESLDNLVRLDADGVLLNDIRLGVDYMKNR